MKPEKCERVAMGGVFSALCLLLMFLAAVVPFASIAMPMLAGAMLTVVVIENGAKTAMMVYISVSLLSAFMVPDLDAKLLFIMFFGYYSMIRPPLEKLRLIPARYAAKLLIFNAALVIGYYISISVGGVEEAVGSLLGEYGPIMLLIGFDVTFLLYDFVLTKYTWLYLNWFKPTFLRR